MKLNFLLKEITIKQLSKNINVKIDIDKTKHASERQHRHKDEITDNDIIDTANKSLDKIAKDMIFNKIDIGDKIVIYDKKTDLNLVGAIKDNKGVLDLVIITVMKKSNFKPKSGTKKIEI